MSLNPSLYATLSATSEPTQVTAQYVWGARPGHRDELVRRDRDTNGDGTLAERLYCLMDYFNPTATVDETGEVVERYSWSAFGLRMIMDSDWEERTSSAYVFDFGFHGQFLDGETGYYNYGFRYYSPQIGRWLSRDPIEEEGGANLFAYAENSAIGTIDLHGLIDWNSKERKTTVPGVAEPGKSPPEFVGNKYTVLTSAGNPILTWAPDFGRTNGTMVNFNGQRVVVDSSTLYWCHGFTFDGHNVPGVAFGPFSIYGNQVPIVLQDENWKWIPCYFATANDIVVYAGNNNWNDPYHSGKVFSVATTEKQSDPGKEFFDETESQTKSKFGLAPEHAKIRNWMESPTGGQLSGEYRCYKKMEENPMNPLLAA
ncbi:MAG: RHS repeat-associated core domain-containing protein [Verrucomicrobiae bacterium]|nr:RHS repeat-associated core domain-containing protein [Verrucomicrobiae bacterium]